ncbi:hypothetical protein DRP77_13100 [Candidatus Poribacteria bacterium]|nr:MAG: hypothetical protein DRP77_13100 [Candidatus Poribacteria bacterium]
MTILLMPYMDCPLRCEYCFEKPVLGTKIEANIDAMTTVLNRIYARGAGVSLHGGEPLAAPIEHVEALLQAIYRLMGRSGVQTNGLLITDRHIRLFKRYCTHVGISMDGPPELSVLRRFKDRVESGREVAKKVNENIAKLRENGISVGILCVLGRHNAGDEEKLGKLFEWVEWLRSIGVSGGRFLVLKACEPRLEEYTLTPEEVGRVWIYLYRRLRKIGWECAWSPFRDFINALKGKTGQVVCWLGCCDPWLTKACHPIFPDGTTGLCDRTFIRGLYLRPEGQPLEIRAEILKETDCKGCKWWGYCHGGCPYDAVDNDWRNKSSLCPAIKMLFEEISRYYPPTSKPTETREGYRHGDSPHRDWSNHGDSG